MNIFEAIREDHEKQRVLMRVLVETSGASESREKFFKELKAELNKHAIAEERYFYVPLMDSDNTIEPARHAIAEHHEIDELVETLVQTNMSSSAWLVHMKSLQELVLHHLNEEEHEFFQQAGKVLSAQQKVQLASSYRHEMLTQRGK